MSTASSFISQYLGTLRQEYLNKKMISEASVKSAKTAVDEQRYKLTFANGNQEKLTEALANYVDKQATALQKHEVEASERYAAATWFTKCLSNTQSFRVTHVPKFSHSAISGVNPPLFVGVQTNDGYLKSGNVTLQQSIDVSGDAVLNQTILEFYHLLNTDFSEQKLIHAFERSEPELVDYITAQNINFEDLRLKAIHHFYDKTEQPQSDGLLKQVYFPVENSYHLLSIVTHSGIVAEVRKRIQAHKFGNNAETKDNIKYARQCKKDNTYCEQVIEDYYNLTEIGFGGTKPQNISVFNNANFGLGYLLPSLPPSLSVREVQLPSSNFFSTFKKSEVKGNFVQLHKLMKSYKNNMQIRDEIQAALHAIIDQIVVRVHQIRKQGGVGWTERESYQTLPLHQCILLDEAYTAEFTATDSWATGYGERAKNHLNRQEDDSWLDTVIDEAGRWIVNMYQSILGENKLSLGDDELNFLKILVDQVLIADRGLFV